jgi:hypothetical protein
LAEAVGIFLRQAVERNSGKDLRDVVPELAEGRPLPVTGKAAAAFSPGFVGVRRDKTSMSARRAHP